MAGAPEEPLREFVADLHVHVGSAGGRMIKIGASRALTLPAILAACATRKGIDIVGVVDCQAAPVLAELRQLAAAGELVPLAGGGLAWREAGARGAPGDSGAGAAVTLLPGSELEVVGERGRRAHFVALFRGLEEIASFAGFLAGRVKNPGLSTPRVAAGVGELCRAVRDRGGLFFPAHAFTPHRGLIGAWGRLPAEVLEGCDAVALELGLSADTAMAETIPGLGAYTYLSNSDAHSLETLGREHNLMALAAPTFDEVARALGGRDGRGIAANVGLDPRLGKYHRTACPRCGIAEGPPPVLRCPACGSARVVVGVLDRVAALADRLPAGAGAAGAYGVPVARDRPPYRRQVPLARIPGAGPRARERLIAAFGSEIRVLHRAPEEELARIAGRALAARIMAARRGELAFVPGGGGRYGKVMGAAREP